MQNSAKGFGIILDEDYQEVYKGEIISEKKHGIGREIEKEKGRQIYEGEFKEDQRNGIGSIYLEYESMYTGEWKNGKRDGFVKLIFFN